MEIKFSKKPILYNKALEQMQKRVEQIISGKKQECLWFLEHEDVFTAGTSANVDLEVKNLHNIPLIQTGRGGKITYHGPKQRIVYIMLRLNNHYPAIDLKKFIFDLESWIINSLAKIGIKAGLKEGKIGIWVGDEKIAAIGIRVKKGVSFHGVAININPDLEKFNYIVPCGIAGYGVTSIHQLGVKISVAEFDKILLEEFMKGKSL
jgi:lipoyl(octanoyl) transferase